MRVPTRILQGGGILLLKTVVHQAGIKQSSHLAALRRSGGTAPGRFMPERSALSFSRERERERKKKPSPCFTSLRHARSSTKQENLAFPVPPSLTSRPNIQISHLTPLARPSDPAHTSPIPSLFVFRHSLRQATNCQRNTESTTPSNKNHNS